MTTIAAFAALLLGYVPMIVVVAVVVTTLWIATKAFPKFGAQLHAIYDAIMGVNEEYDLKHNTGYVNPRRW